MGVLSVGASVFFAAWAGLVGWGTINLIVGCICALALRRDWRWVRQRWREYAQLREHAVEACLYLMFCEVEREELDGEGEDR